ncbi:MAG: molybdopterin-dependent oxidoreductase [Deltaproteobacteria bacterium]|jgi:anaerobic selenocysteine-containing dehydrogenase|nr:molybdopterin-dependent oxidoreductase [Deltaproteobacteria bacterium]MBW2496969.1 molybdopterin-dependent oxidoreductase [Deltaproteobacteria bacterium]
MATETHPSICRFCHANCGILVEVQDGRPVRVEGDRANPAYHGFTCAKGRRLPDQHAHPDRLLHSQKKIAPGRFEAIPSEQAMDEVAQAIGKLVREHGPRSVALYLGTYSGPHPAAIPAAIGWALALGSKMVFSSQSIDQPGKHIANALHGRWLGGSHVFEESDVWLLLGNNPLISMSGGIPPSNPGRRLREAKRRGLKLIVIDPRKTEVARFADVYLQPRPGEDPTILAAMLHVILRDQLHDEAFIGRHVQGVEALADVVAEFTPKRAAVRAGVEASEIELAARTFAAGPRGCGVAGTGPNMAPHGNLSEYLLLALNTLCGRWRREGERVPNPGALLPRATPKAQALGPRPAWGRGESLRSRPLGSSAAGLPTGALSDEILYEGEDRIRALVCVGSNPVAAWPDQLKALRAMEALELLVCLDPRLGATARLADYVIAPKLCLETPGLSVSSEGIEQTYVAMGYSEPYAQYTPAIVASPEGSDVIEEWEFFHGLARRMDLALTCYPIRPETGVLRERREPVVLDMEKRPTTDALFEALMNGSRKSLDEIKRYPHGHVFDDEVIRVAPADDDASDRLDVGNTTLLEELAGIGRGLDETQEEDARPFRLISRRMPNVYNSTGQDIPALSRGRPFNPAYLHPDDLEMLGLDEGDVVEIESAHASIVGIAERAPELRRGLVSMAHCFGDAPENDARLREIGSNTGRLVDNASEFDPYTGIPRMSAIPVAIRSARPLEDPR